MVNGIRANNLHRLNKGHSTKFRVDSKVWQETPEEGRGTHQSKHCEYNNRYDDNSQKTLNDKNILFISFSKNESFPRNASNNQ